MSELLAAQMKGGDLKPDQHSMNTARPPDPPHPDDRFPGHAAWIDGDWKLHRMQAKGAKNANWELYNLANDRAEAQNIFAQEPARAKTMQAGLEAWLKSVASSLNGEDY